MTYEIHDHEEYSEIIPEIMCTKVPDDFSQLGMLHVLSGVDGTDLGRSGPPIGPRLAASLYSGWPGTPASVGVQRLRVANQRLQDGRWTRQARERVREHSEATGKDKSRTCRPLGLQDLREADVREALKLAGGARRVGNLKDFRVPTVPVGGGEMATVSDGHGPSPGPPEGLPVCTTPVRRGGT